MKQVKLSTLNPGDIFRFDIDRGEFEVTAQYDENMTGVIECLDSFNYYPVESDCLVWIESNGPKFIPTSIKTAHPLADSMGNPLSLKYVGPSDIGGPFAFCWQGEPMDRFTAEEINEILSEGEIRTTPKGKTYLRINW